MVEYLNMGWMPPMGYASLSASDKARILSWLNCGTPE
jgi:hypothetical protein